MLLKQGNTKEALAKYDEALKYAPNRKELKEAREAAAKSANQFGFPIAAGRHRRFRALRCRRRYVRRWPSVAFDLRSDSRGLLSDLRELISAAGFPRRPGDICGPRMD